MKLKIALVSLLFLAGTVLAQIPAVPATGDVALTAAKTAFNQAVKDIRFAYGSSELKLNDPKYSIAGVSIDAFMKQTLIPALAKLVSLLPAGQQVIVEGNACKTGSEEASEGFIGNIALSQERAEAVKQYLLANSKVDGSRFKIVANGSSKPKSGIDAADVKNCRVSMKIE